MLLYGELWPEDVELWAHSYVNVHFLYLCLDAVAGHETVATRGLEDTSNHGNQCCLACTIGPK